MGLGYTQHLISVPTLTAYYFIFDPFTTHNKTTLLDVAKVCKCPCQDPCLLHNSTIYHNEKQAVLSKQKYKKLRGANFIPERTTEQGTAAAHPLAPFPFLPSCSFSWRICSVWMSAQSLMLQEQWWKRCLMIRRMKPWTVLYCHTEHKTEAAGELVTLLHLPGSWLEGGNREPLQRKEKKIVAWIKSRKTHTKQSNQTTSNKKHLWSWQGPSHRLTEHSHPYTKEA